MFTDLYRSFIQDVHSSTVCPVHLPVCVKKIFDNGYREKLNAFCDKKHFFLISCGFQHNSMTGSKYATVGMLRIDSLTCYFSR